MKILFVLLLAIPLFFAFFSATETTCPLPSNVHVSSQSANSVSFSWDGGSANGYIVKYIVAGSASSNFHTANAWVSFSNLPCGSYDFYFRTDCAGESSEAIVVEDLVIY